MHVVISLVGIGSGFVVLAGLLRAKRLDGWTALFLAHTRGTTETTKEIKDSIVPVLVTFESTRTEEHRHVRGQVPLGIV